MTGQSSSQAGVEQPLDILMYHSVGSRRKPLGLSTDTFRMQLDVLGECGFVGESLVGALKPRISGSRPRVVALTFDDGYRDFVDVALPEVVKRGWKATVFLCSGLVGVNGGWDPDGRGAMPILSWADAKRLAADAAVEIGSHGVNHFDLTRLPLESATREIVDSQQHLVERTRTAVTSFAMPFGRTNAAVQDVISRVYDCAVGTSLGQGSATSPRFNLPRIEMWYFQNARRWRAYLEGARLYLWTRRRLRRFGSLLR